MPHQGEQCSIVQVLSSPPPVSDSLLPYGTAQGTAQRWGTYLHLAGDAEARLQSLVLCGSESSLALSPLILLFDDHWRRGSQLIPSLRDYLALLCLTDRLKKRRRRKEEEEEKENKRKEIIRRGNGGRRGIKRESFLTSQCTEMKEFCYCSKFLFIKLISKYYSKLLNFFSNT